MNKILILFSFLILLFSSCSVKNNQPKKVEPHSRKNESLFSLISSEITGIKFRNIITEDLYFNFLNYPYIYNGGGVASGDINNDGLVDLYFTSNQQSNKLYLNKGNFEFENITEKAQVEDDRGWTTGATMIDINHDGYLDIYVCKSGSLKNDLLRKNKLYINQKDNTFQEKAHQFNLDDGGYGTQAYFFDYDKDNDLDLYLVNHRPDFRNNVTISLDGKNNPFPYSSDKLYRNDGKIFTNITQQAGITNNAWGLSAAIGDFNNDTYPDVYVCNDFLESDFLYINNQNGTFTNKILDKISHISANSMGSDYADINNDTYPDLLVLDMTPEDHIRNKENMATMSSENFHTIVRSGHHYQYMANMLQLNNQDGQFSEIGQLAGIAKTDWSWAPLVADFDNDGLKDVFITNGILRELNNQDFRTQFKRNIQNRVKVSLDDAINMMPSSRLENYFYKNNGDLTFTKTIEAWGLTFQSYSNGAAYADLNNDGNLDLIINNIEDEASIYKNNAKNNYIQIQLEGSTDNPLAIGAKVTVFADNSTQYQELYLSRGFQSSVPPVLHFGLKSAEKITNIEIGWPTGEISSHKGISMNKKHTFSLVDAEMVTQTTKDENKLFTEIFGDRLGIRYAHKENIFNDFKNQVLLPYSQSHNGPFMSSTDINNDGLDDFYVGGAANQSGALYIQLKDGSFQLQKGPWQAHKTQEDLGVLFFDVDNDGDQDLYIISGGSEFPENSLQFQDRLYINNGNGQFHTTSTQLPNIISSGQIIKASDIDNDGDLDLFAGGRIIPDKYPYPPKSCLLINHNGSFEDAIAKLAPDLEYAGMITDAEFADSDGDGDQDLIIVGEWMAVQIFENNNGKFTKAANNGLDSTMGIWFSVAVNDIDHDGDLDFFAGNMGLNTKYKTSGTDALHIYCDDFDKNGTYDIILTSAYHGAQVPVRGKECSIEQLPFIHEKFPTFQSFAHASINDILGQQNLNKALHYQAQTLTSVFIENLGKGKFKVMPLPNEAQFAPITDFNFTDFNDSTHILAVGNLYHTEVETIRQDASFGTVLKYTNQTFKAVPNNISGFITKGDAKSMIGIKGKNVEYIFVANNNSTLNIFRKSSNW
jgi:hypothetical protein